MQNNNDSDNVEAVEVPEVSVQEAVPVSAEDSKAAFLERLANKGLQDSENNKVSSNPVEIDEKDIFKEEVDQIELAKEKARQEEANLKEVPKEAEEEEEEPKIAAKSEEVPSEESKESDTAALDPDKTYKIKVDGKMVDITGAELQAKASAELAVEKRFAEVDKERKAWQDTKDAEAKKNLEQKERLLNGGIWEVLGEKFDMPAYLLKENLLKSLEPEVLRRSQLSESQVEAQRILEERRYYKDSYEAQVRQREEEQRESALAAEANALNQEIDEAKAKHGISQEQWDAAYKRLDETLPPEVEAIEVDMIVEAVLKDNTFKPAPVEDPSTKLESMADKALEPYSKHINEDFRSKLLDFMAVTPDLTEDQLNDIVKQSVTKGLKKNLLGAEEGSKKNLSKAEKLKQIEEKAMKSVAKNSKPNADRNWF